MHVPECPYKAYGLALWVSEVSNLLQWGCATEFCVFLLLLTPGLLSSVHVAVCTLGSLLQCIQLLHGSHFTWELFPRRELVWAVLPAPPSDDLLGGFLLLPGHTDILALFSAPRLLFSFGLFLTFSIDPRPPSRVLFFRGL